MKSILMSIQPKWVEKIISGEKTIDIRKTAPKEVPFKAYIYCTYGGGRKGSEALYLDAYGKVSRKANGTKWINGKVIGEFVCNSIIEFDGADETLERQTCLSIGELYRYAKGKALYGLHISDLKVYDKPKDLGEYHRFCGNDGEGCPDADCPYYEEPSYEYGEITYDCYSMRPITRAPQNYVYVEELK